MHIGSYDEEPVNIAEMDAYMKNHRYILDINKESMYPDCT